MGLFIIFVVLITAVVVRLVYPTVSRNYNNETGGFRFDDLCRSLHLKQQSRRWWENPSIKGKIGKQFINVSLKGIFRSRISITLYPPKGAAYSLIIKSKGNSTDSGITDAHGRILYRFATGNENFDLHITVYGESEEEAAALLDEKTRGKIENLADTSDTYYVHPDSMMIDVLISGSGYSTSSVISVIRDMQSLGNILDSKLEVEKKLIWNLFHEKFDDIRMRTINLLASSPTFSKEAKDAFRKVIGNDPDIDIVVAAARALSIRSGRIYYRFLKYGDLNDMIRAIWVIGDADTKLDMEYFVKFIEKEINHIGTPEDRWRLKIETIKLFGKKGQKGASASLVKLLSIEDPDIRDEAIKALATCGNLNAIEPLFVLSKNSGIKLFLKRQIMSTIQSIQKRQGIREYGALSLLQEDSIDQGAVSLADAEEGSVALEKNCDGKLSLEKKNKAFSRKRIRASKSGSLRSGARRKNK